MAGNYPDVPGPRLAYDRDGSLLFGIDDESGSVGILSNADARTINNENNDSINSDYAGNHGGKIGLIFPELRDIIGYCLVNTSMGWDTLQTSVDTTSGVDGTWVTRISGGIPRITTMSPNYRTGINVVSWSGIRALRMRGGDFFDASNILALHLYGSIAAGQTPDRLRLWHPTLDQPLDDQAVSPDGAYFDWGNVAQGTSQDRTFRIKNNSATQTANSVTASTEALTPSTIPDVFTLSKDGTTFTATINFTAIAPGAISSVCTLRRTTPANATLSLAAMRLNAVAVSWT